MRSKALLELRHITKRFGALLANDDISLSLRAGEILALLGENGAGKTTLMNILFGHYTADSGHILIDGKPLEGQSTEAALACGIGMVHQHFTLAENMTVLENIMLGTESLWRVWSNRTAARSKLQGIIHSLQLDVTLESRVAELSIGQRQRVEILKVLYRDVRVLILDEPTAVLTPQEVDSLFDLLRMMVGKGMAIILISHKLNEVLSISHRVAVLRAGKLVAQLPTADVNRDELAELIVGRQVARPVSESMQVGDSVMTLAQVNLQRRGHLRALTDINLDIKRHEIVGIAGVAGNGQQELGDILSGVLDPSSGSICFKQTSASALHARELTRAGVARIPEDRHSAGIVGDMSVWENLMLEDLGQAPCWRVGQIINRAAAKRRAVELVELFDIRCVSIDIPATLLSGGNIQKLILARNFRRNPDFVLANQPARGLDEGAIAFVHTKLLQARQAGAAIVLFSEDLDELLRLSDRIVVMYSGQLSSSYPAESLTQRTLGTLMTGGEVAAGQVSVSEIDHVF